MRGDVPPEAIAAVWAYRLRTLDHPPQPSSEQASEIAAELKVAWPFLRSAEHQYKPLTVRQREIYDFIVSSYADRGIAPSFEEIAEHMGFSSLSTVHEHLTNLERKGWIFRAYNEVRAIHVI